MPRFRVEMIITTNHGTSFVPRVIPVPERRQTINTSGCQHQLPSAGGVRPVANRAVK
jgi:hypothetical protein